MKATAPLHVCLVTHVFLRTDGQGRVNLEIARHLARRGHRVTLVGTQVDDELAARPNVTAHRITVPPWIPTTLLRYGVFALRSRHVLRRERSRGMVIHLNGAISLHRSHVNASHFVHAQWLRRGKLTAGSGRHWRNAYYRFIGRVNAYCERRAYHGAPWVVAVSDLVREGLVHEVGVAPHKIRVIPNGVDAGEFRPRRAGELDALRDVLGLDPGTFLVFFAGDAKTARKNLDLVLRAIQQMGSACHLVVAGSHARGPYPAMAIRLGIAERVHFLGARQDLAALLRWADVFVLPSHYDPCPLVLLEAMASGIPVITSPMVGNATAIRDGENGFVLASSDDQHGLTDLLRDLAANPDRARAVGDAGRGTAEALSWEAMAGAYEVVYEAARAHLLADEVRFR